MSMISQDIKITCENSIIKGAGAKSIDGHPWRNWKITLIATEESREIKGKLSIILDHVEYILHPTFEEPRRVKKKEPYVLEEKGWGEFDMRVVLYFTNNVTDPQVLLFDLNFAMSNYSFIHTVKFYNPSPELKKLLAKEPFSHSPPLGPRKGGKKPMGTSLDLSESYDTKTKYTESLSPQLEQLPLSPGFDGASNPSNSLQSSPYLKSPSGETMISYNGSYSDAERIVDAVYNINDVYNLKEIHRADIADSLRDEWDIPNISMMELVKRYFRLTKDQSYEFQKIIVENMQPSMDITVNEYGVLTFDFYTLGRVVLEKLWDLVADMGSDDDQSFASQDFHSSDLEFHSDLSEHDTLDHYAGNGSDEDKMIADTCSEGVYVAEEDTVIHSFEKSPGNYGSYSHEYTYDSSEGTFENELPLSPYHNINYDVEEPAFQSIGSSPESDYYKTINTDDRLTVGYHHEVSDMDIQYGDSS